MNKNAFKSFLQVISFGALKYLSKGIYSQNDQYIFEKIF